MAKYNINQIQKMVDRLEAIGIKSEKAVLDMPFEILEDIPNYTLADVKTILILRKIAKTNKNALHWNNIYISKVYHSFYKNALHLFFKGEK